MAELLRLTGVNNLQRRFTVKHNIVFILHYATIVWYNFVFVLLFWCLHFAYLHIMHNYSEKK